MNVVFLSNFINHHQIPFCNAMHRNLGEGNFFFVQSEEMSEERKDMGWSVKEEDLPYLRKYYEAEEECRSLIEDCDVLLAGWTSKTDLVIDRMKKKKLTVRVSERLYREGQWKALSPRGLIHKYLEHIRFRKSNAYLLCCGAYVASDFHLIGAYPNKMYKFGYFPSVRKYDLPKLFEKKDESGMIEIVFAGRFLKLKHPEYMVWLARDLKHESERRVAAGKQPLPEFRIHMIGD
nr:glycosyltransferase family 1 protein [Lachnospiraceae bacterium]